MLKVKEVSAYYGGIQALREVSIEAVEGQILSIIGANGAGKSTLLKCVSGMIPEVTGEISFLDEEITKLPPDRIVAKGISQVPEGHQVIASLKVIDNLHLGAYHYFRKKNAELIRQNLQQLYGMFPILEARRKQLAGTLSGGERQMLAIGRALMSRPRLLLLDEPSMGLAPLIVREIFAVIRRLHADGVTIVLVEQNAKAALQVSEYGYVLETGQITLSGPASDLLSDENVKRAYLGG